MSEPLLRLRIDKWLWAARFFKTRSLAAEEIGKGRITVNGDAVKASREVKYGDLLEIRVGQISRTVAVLGVSAVRGPAPQAQKLYEETADSVAARVKAAEQRRLAPEPAHSIEGGRPSKRDRRAIEKGWGDRWSASLDED
jgi:ribosome-associated heat shock protein Hsp15